MEIIKVTPRGYCRGVTRAIQLAKQTALTYPDKPIYVLGMLVHNMYVMEALQLLQIKTVDDKKKSRMELLDQIPQGSVVIFTAHGIAPAVIEKAESKGLICIDASCPDVIKTQQIVKSALQQGNEILYIGKKHHPEAEAVLALSDHVHLICDTQDIQVLPAFTQVFVTNQTTMSIFDINTLFTQIKEKYPHATICEEICNATRIRQQAVADLKNANIDVLYVVGDKHSNNSNRLATIAKEQGIPHVFLIDDVNGIEDEQLTNMNRVAITSGASTPTYLTNQVITYIEHFNTHKAKEPIDLSCIL